MEGMPLKARLHLITVCVMGLLVLATDGIPWESTGWWRFGFYTFIFLASSCFKVWLPGITGTMSMNFIFVLLAILDLSVSETLTMVAVGTLAQVFWRAEKRPTWIQAVFNVAIMAIASGNAYHVYHSPTLERLLHSSSPLLLVLSACVYFIMNTLAVAAIIGLAENKPVCKTWMECYLWSFPYYLVGAALAGGFFYVSRIGGWQALLLAIPVPFVMYKSFQLYFSKLAAETKLVSETADLHLRTIQALAAAIEAKDENTHDHLERVQVYAVKMGEALKLPGDILRALRAAALLHDIGKLAVPEHIINKPGPLTKEEFEKMKIHPVVGAEILERVQFPYPVVPIVRYHHEKWDGSGYPRGLKEEEIPIAARIISIVDCLDALASDRPYRRAMPLDEAMSVVVSQAGKSYDPHLVALLAKHCEEWETLAQSQPSRKQKLETHIVVPAGETPDAGLASESAGAAAKSGSSESRNRDFVTSIAAARQEVQALYELSLDLGSSLSFEETMSVLDVRLSRLVAYDTIAVFVRGGDRLTPRYSSGLDKDLFANLEIPVGEGLSGWVAQHSQPIINGNPSVETGYMGETGQLSVLRSALCAPLEHVDENVGVLALYRRDKSAFCKDDLRVLMAVVPKLSLSLVNAARYREVKESAATDGLTGLPNAKSLFMYLDAEVSRSKRTGTPLSLIVCDLDGFKAVNDQFGHLVGNVVLKKVAERFRRGLRAYDYIARMGGDEFVVVLTGTSREAAGGKVDLLTRLVEGVGREECGGTGVSASIGLAALPDDGYDAETLLAIADKRMYRMKHLRKPSGAADLAKLSSAVEKIENAESLGASERPEIHEKPPWKSWTM